MLLRPKIIDRITAYEGFLRLICYRLRIPVIGRDHQGTLNLERIEGLRSAAVLPYDPMRQRVVLVKQFRIGALDAAEGAWLLEPPGGVIDTDESEESAARREAWEESGCRIGAMTRICVCRTSPGFSDERVTIFCGEVNCAGLKTIGGQHGEGEWTQVITMDLDVALRDLGQGPLSSATVIIALQWLALNRRRLREQWDLSPTAKTRSETGACDDWPHRHESSRDD